MVSILTVMMTGQQIETAIVGNEGVVGGWMTINSGPSNTQSTVQIEGVAWRLSAANFLAMYEGSNGFSDAMNRYLGVILFQAQQSAGCHAVHSVEARFCRWLLLSEDITQSKHIPLNRNFCLTCLASKDRRFRCALTLCRNRVKLNTRAARSRF
jgi:hypothetical protein